MKILKRKSLEERLTAKIYAQAKKEYDRKLDFKTQEIRSEALKEVAELKSKNRKLIADHRYEMKQMRYETDAKSKRLDREIRKYTSLNAELDDWILKVKNNGALLAQMMEKISMRLYSERKAHADLEDDKKTVNNLISESSHIRG